MPENENNLLKRAVQRNLPAGGSGNGLSGLDVSDRLLRRIPERVYVTFFAALVFGFITHLYMITNKIPNWDDLYVFTGMGCGESFGRWFIAPVHYMFSRVDSPAVNGAAAIVLYSLSAAIISEILDLRSRTACVLAAALFLTFPSIGSNLTYMYLGGVYSFAVLLAVTGVLITVKFRYGFLAGWIFMVLSMGCYQSYFALATALLLMVLLEKLCGGEKFLPLFREGVKYLAFLVLSMAVYLLRMMSFDLADYRGISNVGQAGASAYLLAVARAYHRILQFFVTAPPSYFTGREVLFNRLAVVMIFVTALLLILQRKMWKEPARLLAFLILGGLLPLGCSLTYVMAPDVEHATTPMIMAYVCVYLLPVAFSERLVITGAAGEKGGAQKLSVDRKAAALQNAVRTAAAFLTVIILSVCAYHCFRVTGDAYFRNQLAFTRIENFYERIMVKLEETGDYTYDQPYLIAGDYWPEKNILSSYGVEMERYEDLEGISMENGLFTSGVRYSFIREYLGVDSPEVSEEDAAAIMSTEEYQNMPSYPREGCVRKINGVFVVKIN